MEITCLHDVLASLTDACELVFSVLFIYISSRCIEFTSITYTRTWKLWFWLNNNPVPFLCIYNVHRCSQCMLRHMCEPGKKGQQSHRTTYMYMYTESGTQDPRQQRDLHTSDTRYMHTSRLSPRIHCISRRVIRAWLGYGLRCTSKKKFVLKACSADTPQECFQGRTLVWLHAQGH